MTRLCVSLFGIGFLRPWPGTWGSLAALGPAVAVLALGGPAAVLVGAGIIAAVGWWAVTKELALTGERDPEWIVIDEAAGQWLTLAGLSHIGWFGVLAAFAVFRLFDLAKPGPVGWADRQCGSHGVMLDDLVAGALAACVLLVLGAAFPLELFP